MNVTGLSDRRATAFDREPGFIEELYCSMERGCAYFRNATALARAVRTGVPESESERDRAGTVSSRVTGFLPISRSMSPGWHRLRYRLKDQGQRTHRPKVGEFAESAFGF